MILLVHSAIPVPLCVSEDWVSNVVIENPSIFRDIIAELYAQVNGEDGDWKLVENFKSLLVSKNIELILTPFELDFGQRKIMNKIYSDLEKLSVEPELFEKTMQFRMQMQEYLQYLLLQYSVALTWDDMISTTAVAKAANVIVNTEEMSCLEKIIAYLRLFSDLRLARIFVFVNLKTFLSPDELKILYKEAKLNKFIILCLEHYNHDRLEEGEKKLILDLDMCEIVNDFGG